MWNLPMISTLGVNYFPLKFGLSFTKIFDQSWLEYYGSQNLNKNLSLYSKFLPKMYLNYLKIYFMLMILWVSFLIVFI